MTEVKTYEIKVDGETKAEFTVNSDSPSAEMSPEVDIYSLLQKSPADFTVADCERVCEFMREEAKQFAAAEKAKSTKSPARKPKPSSRADVQEILSGL